MEKSKRDEGMALIAVMAVIIILVGAASLVLQLSATASRSTSFAVTDLQLHEAGKSGVDATVDYLWSGYLDSQDEGKPGTVTTYFEYVDGIVPNDGSKVDLLSRISTSKDLAIPGGATVTAVTASRTDDAAAAYFEITVVASLGDVERTSRQSVRIGGALVNAPEFALLANNINCILCHANISSGERLNNTESDNFNSFDRVKMGSLETLMISTLYLGGGDFTSHGNFDGTVYTRGDVVDFDGSPIDEAGVAASHLTSSTLNDDGTILQDASGNTTNASPAIAGLDADGLPIPGGNMYLDYPADEAEMTDGILPTEFPSPFSDEDGDKILSDAEFQPFLDDADGNISGGVVYGVSEGSTYGDVSLPTSSNGAAAALSGGGTYDGNVILVGTDAAPIEIDGTVVIDGDLVIQGKVKGLGELMVRGNIYVTGDVTYADDTSYGVASDGTINGLAVKAGGNILMGDYQTRSGIENPANRNSFMKAGHIQVREADPGHTDNKGVPDGYFNPKAVDTGAWATGADEHWMSFTSVELAMFNSMEIDKALADSSYTPRLYQLNDDNDFPDKPFAVEWLGGNITSKRYNNGDFAIVDKSIMDRAVVQTMEPKDNWISNDTLRQIWYEDEMSRSPGDKFTFDGLLYTNNAIFGIVRNELFHGSNTHGQFELRGALLAPDVGMLVPGRNFSVPKAGFDLIYDRRVQQFVRIPNSSIVDVDRLIFRNV